MSKSQSENTEVTVILIMLVYITSICQQRREIIFNPMIITVLINDNS